MAKRIFKVATYTLTAVADTTNFTNQSYQALQGGSSTQVTQLSEVFVGGQGSSGGVVIMQLSRDSTVGATLTALTTNESDAAMDPATAALAAPVVPFTQSTTKPQRSASLGLMNFSFNGYGGVVRWQAYDEKDMPKMLGSTASLGEVSFSPYTGTAAVNVGSHLIYETK
jgi:hypothetical protein